jgi:hypothetical protein
LEKCVSKTGRTAYYRGRNLRRAHGVFGNYLDVQTGQEYWISGDYLKLVEAKVAAKLRP